MRGILRRRESAGAILPAVCNLLSTDAGGGSGLHHGFNARDEARNGNTCKMDCFRTVPTLSLAAFAPRKYVH